VKIKSSSDLSKERKAVEEASILIDQVFGKEQFVKP